MLSAAGMSAAPRWRARVARWLHLFATASLLLAVEIFFYGGFRIYFLRELSATHTAPPLLMGLGCTGLAQLLDPRPWPDLPILKLARFVARGIGDVWSPRGMAVSLLLVAIAAFGLQGEIRHWHHTQRGQALIAAGKNEEAAEQFLLAERFFEPEHGYLRQSAGYAHWRAGHCDKTIAYIEPYVRSGAPVQRRAFRALWRCYHMLGRIDDAIAVTKAAMGTYAELENEAARVLRILTRERVAGAKGSFTVVFSLAAGLAPEGAAEVYLAGNWSAEGEPAEILGWEPQRMERRPEGFVLTRPLHGSGDFPFVAVATTTSDFSSPAIGFAQFKLKGNSREQRIELQAHPDPGWLPSIGERRTGADGKKRVLALWPDAGSWFLLNSYVHRGLMPNLRRVIGAGARGDMVSTNPPFTATAYRRMVEMTDGKQERPQSSLVETVSLQLTGIPFLDRLFPDSLAAGSRGPTVYSVLAEHGFSAANLVFNDRFLSDPTDLTTADGKKLALAEDALANARDQHDLDDDVAAWLMRDIVHVDAIAQPERAKLYDRNPVMAMGIENTEHKARAGLEVWTTKDLYFMLLRFPSIDILSHDYFNTVERSPLTNPMVEAYRHLDDVVGRFVATLDEDDTLIFVSDHGIAGTLHHHPTCVLILNGPGFLPGSTIPTIPIGHFPIVVLSRFGITDGAERIDDELYRQLFGVGRMASGPADGGDADPP